jgi:DNA-binding response OmpR family regulator
MVGRIVVVEDEPELRGLIEDLLELEGFDVAGTGHPAHISDLVRERRPDLFLIDIMLPEISGIELAQQLQEQGYTGTPMIAMTASRFMSKVASESGIFSDVIDKPFEIDDLLSRVQRYGDCAQP